MRFTTAVALSALPALAAAGGLGIQMYAMRVLSAITYIDNFQAPGFGVWIQLAHESVKPIFKNNKNNDMTILMPNTEAFDTWIRANGGNSTDPESLTTRDWESKWADTFEFFFFKGILNTTTIEEGETVVLESFKKSPVGDWYLTTSFRRNAIDPSTTITYNGTLSSGPYDAVNISIPDFVAGPHCWAQVVGGWVSEPQNLSITIESLNVTSWSKVASRLPSIAALETTQNFTLFVPPEASISAALALSDDALLAFVDAHLIQGSRVILSTTEQELTTVSGKALKATSKNIAFGSINANVTYRDVITNGGIIQAISTPLVSLNSSTAARAVEEL